MKYIISETRFDKLIYNFLNSNYIPDDGWGPEIYREVANEIEIFKFKDFYIDEHFSYTFIGPNNDNEIIEPQTLVIMPHIVNKLTDLFGDRWHSVFIRWFEGGTGLSVKHLNIDS